MSSSPRYSLNKNKYLLDPEAERLEHILSSFKDRELRNTSLLYLGLHTGARASEILNLSWGDLNEFERSIYIKGLKGSNDRELPIAPWLFQQLLRLKSEMLKSGTSAELMRSEEKLFQISYNRLRQIWQTYRPVEKKFHCLRHTFAIRLYKKTKDLRLVQFALGHRNITNTMIYADYVYSQQELKKLLL